MLRNRRLYELTFQGGESPSKVNWWCTAILFPETFADLGHLWWSELRGAVGEQGKKWCLQGLCYGLAPSSVQFSSVAQSCLTLRDPVNRSTPGLPVHHQLPEFTQTHVHWVGDAIQPSHPLSSGGPTTSYPEAEVLQFHFSLLMVTQFEFSLSHTLTQCHPLYPPAPNPSQHQGLFQ